MMRTNRTAKMGLTLALFIAFVGTVPAEEEATVTGKIMCAKCTLKEADAKSCQDVLVSEDEDGAVTEYYIEKNKVAEEFGHTCQGEKPVTVTGKVTDKDGRMWIAPAKMTQVKG